MTTFTHLLVTAPREEIALTYQKQLEALQAKLPFLRCKILCVADPAGVRIGSGGGTLNALHHLDACIGREALLSAKIAIIHSGGDSRRAPLHTVCGKAWASINAMQGEDESLVATPLTLLVEELSIFCASVLHPKRSEGCVVVASSDVMLDIVPTSRSRFEKALVYIPSDAVSVVGVPEDMNVAKNHGVLVPQDMDAQKNRQYFSEVASCYLQKPTITVMQQAGAIFDDNRAFIDTGVVIFTGKAVRSFVSLLDDATVNICTSRGLETDHGNRTLRKLQPLAHVASLPKSSPSYPLPIFTSGLSSPPPALRLELYSDILHALRLSDGPPDLPTYFCRLGMTPSASLPGPEAASPYITALKAIWVGLRTTSLHLIGVHTGRFCHLGTSGELLELLCSPNAHIDSEINTSVLSPQQQQQQQKMSIFSKKYHLQPFVLSSVLVCRQLTHTVLQTLGTQQERENDEVIATDHSSSSAHPSGQTAVAGHPMNRDGGDDGSSVDELSIHGVIINSVCCVERPGTSGGHNSMEGSSDSAREERVHRTSVVEHSLLSGDFSVGRRAVVSHVTGTNTRHTLSVLFISTLLPQLYFGRRAVAFHI